MNIFDEAREFASNAHKGQERKYTGEPYIVHPMQVANIVRAVTEDPDMICAALLHDTVEDTHVEIWHIQMAFGLEVAFLVSELTDISKPEDGNRAFRKELDRKHLAGASADAQTIKLADIISNTKSIKEHDPKFWKVYREEMIELLLVLTKGDATLHKIATEQIV
jgi:(p)ppGpp synthase/HD superfamily hydrolase